MDERNELEEKLEKIQSKKEGIFSKHFLSFAYIVLIIIVIFSQTRMHEEVHQQIFKIYGINSTIGVNLEYAYTKPDKNCPIDSDCELLHSLNEIVSYNLQGFEVLFFIATFFIIILMENQRRW